MLSNKTEFLKNIILLFVSFFVGTYILFDPNVGTFRFFGFLPLFHGIIQLISPKRELNIAERLIRVLYFVRNVATPFLMYLTDYVMLIFSIKSENTLQLSVFLMIFETFCVYYFISKEVKVRVYNLNPSPFSISNSHLFSWVFWSGFFITVFIYNIVPQTHDVFMPIYEQDAATVVGLTNDDVGDVGGLNRILFTLFTILFGFYRLLLPIYLIALIKRRIRNDFMGIILSLMIISLQLFFVTEKTMTTLINLLVLLIFLVKIYPKKKKILSIILGSVVLFLLLLIIALKSGEEGTSSLLENKLALSLMLQAYIPNVGNMQGVFYMPQWQFSYLLSDIYNMIPFRNSLLGFDFGPGTTELFREYNSAGGQILPLIGQSYYHFGIFAPILSVFLAKIAYRSFEKSYHVNNYVLYIFYVYLGIFAAMTPCFYYFGIFGSSFLTGMIPIFIISKLQ